VRPHALACGRTVSQGVAGGHVSARADSWPLHSVRRPATQCEPMLHRILHRFLSAACLPAPRWPALSPPRSAGAASPDPHPPGAFAPPHDFALARHTSRKSVHAYAPLTGDCTHAPRCTSLTRCTALHLSPHRVSYPAAGRCVMLWPTAPRMPLHAGGWGA